MLKNLKHTLLLLTLFCTVACFQSCQEEGCTDPNAENYNADADEDDGTCTYARTKFIGTYGAGESCDGGDATSNIVSIAESAQAFNAISITNETLNVTVTGFVTGDNFTINDSFIRDGLTVEMVGDGTYSLSNGEGRINATYTLNVNVAGQMVSQSCVALWLKN